MKNGVIQIDLPAVESLGAALGDFSVALAKELKVAMTDTVTTIEKYAKHRCPVDTGNLRSSITPEIDGFKEGSVGTNSEYAMPVEYGSRPHDIKPRDKQALAFEKGGTKGRYVTTKSGKRRYQKGKSGEPVVVKRVKHPGTKAQPFMEPAFLVGGKVAEKNFHQAVDAALAKSKSQLKGSK